MSKEISKTDIKYGRGKKKWPKALCPKCSANGYRVLVKLAQDGFPQLDSWWFYCGLCDYEQRVSAIGEIAKGILAVD